jgi:hypothetical protein
MATKLESVNTYISILNLNAFQKNITGQLYLNYPRTFDEMKIANVHHFGVNDELWNKIKIKYSTKWKNEEFIGKKYEFIDEFYDTKDFSLIKQNYWLRHRSFQNKPGEWSLKTTEKNELGYCLVKEWNDEAIITNLLLSKISSSVSNLELDNSESRLILNRFPLELVELFPTTRIILEETDTFKFYVDCSGEGYTTTWFLLGGVQFQEISQTSHLAELQSKGWVPNVMSKIVQIISWCDPLIFKDLVDIKAVLPIEMYSDSHIRSEYEPIFPLPF